MNLNFKLRAALLSTDRNQLKGLAQCLCCVAHSNRMFTMLIEREVDVNCSKYFIKSILVYVRKPQLVNKKLSHSANIVTVRLNDGNCQNRFVEKILRNLSTYEHDEVIQRLSEHIDEADIDLNQIERSENGKFLIVNRLEPRDVKKFQSRIIGILVGEILIGISSSMHVSQHVA